jgi:anaerobic selenocysteine-containing dehydrogenase
VLLLPATTRYEIPGGVTETTTERRVVLSPEIRGPRIGEARPEWSVLTELAARVRPQLAASVRFDGTPAIRAEIAAVIPFYRGIEELHDGGDSFQYGGAHLCADGRFPTADGRAGFSAVEVPISPAADGFELSTRRGKQFNSMVQAPKDALTGALRDAILISALDAGRLGIAQGDRLLVRSATGEFAGRAHLAPIAPGNLQVHWPEGNILIAGGRRSSVAGIPDYNARVTLEPL